MALDFSPYQYPFPSRRMVHYASRGMVSATHPEAANAGLTILHQGGNAVDAAIAAAACLPVVEPTCNGLGGDAFAILWTKDNQIFGLNARDVYKRQGIPGYLLLVKLSAIEFFQGQYLSVYRLFAGGSQCAPAA